MTLKEQLERGEYKVDAMKVADAVMRSPLWMLLLANSGRFGTNTWPAAG